MTTKKKTLLEKGDEALSQQVGEGKDILSVMRTCLQSNASVDCTHRETMTVKANMLTSSNDRLEDEELIGQIRYGLCESSSRAS